MRKQLIRGPVRRAHLRRVQFDENALNVLRHGELALTVNSVPYPSINNPNNVCGWARNAISIDCIRPRKGYVVGNMRLHPRWVNTVLQTFCDERVKRIVLRMLGDLPFIPTSSRLDFTRDETCRLWLGVYRQSGMGIQALDSLIRSGSYPHRCRFSGIKYDYGRKHSSGPQPNSPSLDHLDPNINGVLDNIQLLPHCVNFMKSDVPQRELRSIVEAIEHMSSDEYVLSHIPLEWQQKV